MSIDKNDSILSCVPSELRCDPFISTLFITRSCVTIKCSTVKAMQFGKPTCYARYRDASTIHAHQLPQCSQNRSLSSSTFIPGEHKMGILHIAREYARHQLPGRRNVERRLPDQEHLRPHLEQNPSHHPLDIYFLLVVQAKRNELVHDSIGENARVRSDPRGKT